MYLSGIQIIKGRAPYCLCKVRGGQKEMKQSRLLASCPYGKKSATGSSIKQISVV